MTSLRLVFAGSPAAAVPSLRALLGSEHEVAAVITREDSPLGRRGVLSPTPVAAAAIDLGMVPIKVDRLDEQVLSAVEAVAPDLGVIVAYGGLVREPLLSTPRLGWINLHFSLLPRWRGAAPVQRAVIAGDDKTGAAVFQLVPELDAGPVFATSTIAIGRHQTAGQLLEVLAVSGASLLLSVVEALADGTAQATPQIGEVTLAPKLSLEDGRIDWSRDAETVTNLIRGVSPEPGAFTVIDGVRLKILDAFIARETAKLPPGTLALKGRAVIVGTASAPVELRTVLPAGKKAMPAEAWWRGRPSEAAMVAE